MKSLSHLLLPSAVSLAVALVLTGVANGQEKKATPPKPAAPAKTPAKAGAKPAAVKTDNDAGKYQQFLSANMKLLGVLGRYADALAGAIDPSTASLAVTQIETITKDMISVGDEIVKLGRPTPEVEAKLAKDSDLLLASRNVAEQTRTAVEAVSANAEVKTLLTPAIENFQAALNRMQQAADDPQGPAVAEKKPDVPKKPGTDAGSRASAVTPDAIAEVRPTRASEAASVPPPPPPPE